MTAKTAIGGFDFGRDWEKWLAFMAALAALGILPKNWKAALGVAGSALAIYKIVKALGWL